MLLFWLGGRHREVISAAIRVSQKPAVNTLLVWWSDKLKDAETNMKW